MAQKPGRQAPGRHGHPQRGSRGGGFRSCRPGRARGDGLGAFVPLGGAHFARMRCGVLAALSLRRVSSTSRAISLECTSMVLITPSGLMMKVPRSARPFGDVHVKGVGQVRGVAHQRELGLADRGEVSCQTLRKSACRWSRCTPRCRPLELGVVLGGVFHFGGAVEGEGGGHEDHHRPLALEAFFGHGDEFAVVKGSVLKGWTWVLIRDMVVTFQGWNVNTGQSMGGSENNSNQLNE